MSLENLWPIVLILFLLLDLVIIYYVFLWWKKRGFSKEQKAKYQSHWQKICAYPQLTQAVLEADKLLDLILKAKGYEGSLGEKLKRSKTLFSDYNGVWYAHKLRNRIAHELNIAIHDDENKKALRIFEKALRDLGAL